MLHEEAAQTVLVYSGGTEWDTNSNTLLYSSSIGTLASGATGSITFDWIPDTSFTGFLWVVAIDTATQELEGEPMHLALYTPNILSVSIEPSPCSVSDVTAVATLSSAFPFASGPVTVPIMVYGFDPIDQTSLLLASGTVVIAPGQLAIARLDISAEYVNSNLEFVAGGKASAVIPVSFNPSLANVETFTYRLPAANMAIGDVTEVKFRSLANTFPLTFRTCANIILFCIG